MVKKHVGAGTSILMSICDGLVLSIFCRKMESTQTVRKEMDRKVFMSPLDWRFYFDFYLWKRFFLFVHWLGM